MKKKKEKKYKRGKRKTGKESQADGEDHASLGKDRGRSWDSVRLTFCTQASSWKESLCL